MLMIADQAPLVHPVRLPSHSSPPPNRPCPNSFTRSHQDYGDVDDDADDDDNDDVGGGDDECDEISNFCRFSDPLNHLLALSVPGKVEQPTSFHSLLQSFQITWC